MDTGQVRYWKHDPDFALVAADSVLMAAAPSARWVEKSRYGEILYSALRCGWVHEFQPDGSTSAAFEGEHGRPRYQNWATGVRQRLVFPVEYLIDVYERCVHGFEGQCTATGTSPVPP